ncbi:MAG: AMP-binding protein [Luteibaculaceae bacterium]
MAKTYTYTFFMDTGICIDGKFYSSALFAVTQPNPFPAGTAQAQEIFTFLCDWFGHEKKLAVNTSGSTGKPKKIWVEKEHMKASAQATIEALGLQEGNTAILALPVKFIAGKMMLIRAILGKFCIFSVEPTSKPKYPNANFLALTPMQLSNTLEADFKNFTGKLIVGGGKIPSQLLQNIALIEHCTVLETFGMTETLSHIALKRVSGSAKNKYFTCLPNITIGVNEYSELIITAKNLGIEQLQTTDIVELLSEKEFIWQGRSNFTINSGGLKIQPEQFEPQVEQIIQKPLFMAGIPHPILGEEVGIFVEVGKEELNAENLLMILNTKLNFPVSIKKLILCSKFIYTPTNKINRLQTVQHYAS